MMNRSKPSTILCMLLISCCLIFACKKQETKQEKPNILFVLMDDLGYGHFGVYNDTLKVSDFDPFFVQLVDSFQGYSKEKALEFSKTAIPNITKLAKSGLLFTRAHTSSNVCAPSRLGIATGTLQNKFGVYRNGDISKQGILPGTHLAEKIRERGYKTAHIGKWHIGKKDRKIYESVVAKYNLNNQSYSSVRWSNPEVLRELEKAGYVGSVVDEHHPLNHGFDYYYGYNNYASEFYNSYRVWENFEHAGKQPGYNTDHFTNKAMEFMGEQIDENSPFYVQLHYHAVHDSLEPVAPDKYLSKFDAEHFHLNNFYAHINGVDHNMQRIINFLKEKGQYKNTMIVFSSDNGAMARAAYFNDKTGSPLPANAPFSGHKGTYFQGGIRVPMFIHYPQGIKSGAISHQIVSTLDILPTSLELAGGEVPEGIDGKSLSPLFKNANGTSIHDHLIWCGGHGETQGFLVKKTNKTIREVGKYVQPAWAVVQGDYILRFSGKLAPNVYYDHWDGRDALVGLYHIKNDPAEKVNLADKMPEKVKEMATIYFEESEDFLPPANWNEEKIKELNESIKLLKD